jgi:hypothetical protein
MQITIKLEINVDIPDGSATNAEVRETTNEVVQLLKNEINDPASIRCLSIEVDGKRLGD